MFSKRDELQKLIETGRRDQQKLESLQKQFRAMEPRWSELQSECERLESSADAQAGTYSTSASEVFWRERSTKLKQALEAAISRRDALTADICKEISELKNQIWRRNSTIQGAFVNWAFQAAAALPPSDASALLAARAKCEQLDDIAEIARLTVHWSERVEAMPSTSIPLFRIGDAVTAALAA